MIHTFVFFLGLVLTVLCLSTYTYFLRPNSKTYALVLMLGVLVSFWLLPFGFLLMVQTSVTKLTLLMRISNMAAAWLPAAVYWIVSSIVLRGYNSPKMSNYILVASCAFMSVMNGFSSNVITSVNFDGHFTCQFGYFAAPFAIAYVLLYLCYPVRVFLINWKHARGKERIQMKYAAIGLFVSVFVALITNTIMPVFFHDISLGMFGAAASLIAVVLIFYAFNEERLYDLDLLVGPLFNTRKFQFHLLMKEFISKLPLLLSYEKIVLELSIILNCEVGLELFDNNRCIYGHSGELVQPVSFKKELAVFLTPGQIIRHSRLGDDLRSQRLKKILAKASIETLVPLSQNSSVMGYLCLGKKSLEILYSKQDFEQLLSLCDQLTLVSQVIEHKDQILVEKESEIHRLSKAIESLKPAIMKVDLNDFPMLIDENYPLVGENSKLKQILTQAKQIAKYDTPVLITGETGTGKENLAKAIHQHSGRGKFIPVNCSAIPETLIESELFGYKKGAFTGADRNKNGLIVEAHGGTLFLDEIGDIPYSIQTKLLRVLQDSAVQPLGDVNFKYVDVRIICATNCDFQKKIAAGEFREDLYHRIQVIHFDIPPLREREDDVILLAHYFLNQFNKKYKKNCQFSHAFISQLQAYTWPGNIRELENRINRLVCLSSQNDILLEMEQGAQQQESKTSVVTTTPEAPINEVDLSVGLKHIVEQMKREVIMQALQKTQSQKLAAELLKLKPSNLSMYLKKYNISVKEMH